MSQHDYEKKAYLSATPMQRDVVRRLLCEVLACLRAQYLSYQTSHWQVVGGSFYGNHLLFERLYKSVQDQVDALAEKIAGYLGSDVLDLNKQVETIYNYTLDWGRVSCHHERGLQSEEDLQEAIRVAYEGIKVVKAMTLGLDDWLMATANDHERNTYLLQQSLAKPPVEKEASGAPTGEGHFYDDPEKKEVLEFCELQCHLQHCERGREGVRRRPSQHPRIQGRRRGRGSPAPSDRDRGRAGRGRVQYLEPLCH
jgi:DNA-binding ferritin-like protein